MSTTRIRRALTAAGGTAVAASFLLAVTAPAGHAAVRTATPRHPSPSHFTHGRVTNPWFPLKPGTVQVYRGPADGEPGRDVVLVTHRTRVIDGVVCRMVVDKVYLSGRLRERTRDFYAQTKAGTVWYFAETTAELDKQGHVTTREGTFASGRDGAEAGIFMPAHPRVGQTFTQEDYPGHAEDRFTIKSLDAFVTSSVVTSRHALLAEERTPLEPGVVEHKKYVRGIGVVAERTVKGGHDHQKLVAIRHR